MNLNRVVKQLRREATANPKKAAVLGSLAVVALWFWVPLVWGWITPEDTDAEAEAAVTEPAAQSSMAVPPVTAVPAEAAAKEPQSPQHSWRQLTHWMENDPQTLATNLPSGVRDPFRTPKPPVVETQPEDKPGEVPLDLTPENLGMSLSSTAVGPGRRVARISGKSYRQGEPVILVKDGQEIEFTLVEVHPRRVVLEREGEQFELQAPSRADPGRIEVVRGPN